MPANDKKVIETLSDRIKGLSDKIGRALGSDFGRNMPRGGIRERSEQQRGAHPIRALERISGHAAAFHPSLGNFGRWSAAARGINDEVRGMFGRPGPSAGLFGTGGSPDAAGDEQDAGTSAPRPMSDRMAKASKALEEARDRQQKMKEHLDQSSVMTPTAKKRMLREVNRNVKFAEAEFNTAGAIDRRGGGEGELKAAIEKLTEVIKSQGAGGQAEGGAASAVERDIEPKTERKSAISHSADTAKTAIQKAIPGSFRPEGKPAPAKDEEGGFWGTVKKIVGAVVAAG